MNRLFQIAGSIICKKSVFLMVVCAVMTVVPLGYAQDNANNFVFNGKNGISNNASTGKIPASFTAELGRKLADGIEVTAAGSQYPVKFIPITMIQGVGIRKGNIITYAIAPGVHIIYTRKSNGIKEDIVFDNPSSAPSEFAFRLELDPMLEARLDKKGNVLIYGPNSVLSGFIQTGDSKSAELIMKARHNASKDNLLYIIPAPVVIDGAGTKHKDIAHYKLEKSILTLHSGKIAELSAPVSIDPSIVVTTTADFRKGNDEGMISFDTDAISRAVPSGGTVGTWTATTSFTNARYWHTSVAYNGYLYILGGYSYNGSSSTYYNDVQYAAVNANGTIGAWNYTTSFTTARLAHTSVTYNGYLYILGGFNGAAGLNDVQYAPINADGTVGSWSITTSFTTARYIHTSIVYNGYLYVIGGTINESSGLNDVQYAPINANGTIGTWTATTSFTTARYGHTTVAYNGYLYVIGGYGSAFLNDIQYAPINADGTVGTWTATTSFITARNGHTSVAYNGYLYVIGGLGSSYFNDVQYAPINANGTVGTWITTSSFTTTRQGHKSVVYNGYMYVIGGGLVGGYTTYNDVQYASITAASAKKEKSPRRK